MLKPPLATAITSLLGVVVPVSLIAPSFVFAGDNGARVHQTSYATSTVAEREMQRRIEQTERGQRALAEGDRAMEARDYEKAFAEYKFACEQIPNSANTAHAYSHALHAFCDAGVALAEQRITEGRYADAENVLKIVLSENYDPHCRRAEKILARLEEPGYYNKTITPGFRAQVEQVKQYFVDAKGFYDTGRWDLAYKRCEQILALDKYNVAARKMEEDINRRKDDYAQAGYNNTRSAMIWQLDKGWDQPVRRYDSNSRGGPIVQPTTTSRSEAIQRKLREIIVPKLEFREATIREAIDFLKKEERRARSAKRGHQHRA